MQSAKLTVSCSFWACVRRPPDLDGLGWLGEFEPQAAIIVAAATATIRGLEVGLRMTEVYLAAGHMSATARIEQHPDRCGRARDARDQQLSNKRPSSHGDAITVKFTP
jgi:hypothetical protein